MGSWSRRRRVLVAAAVLGVVWLGVVAFLLLDARRSMDQGARTLRRVRARATVTELVDPANRADLRAAEARFARASARLDNPLLGPLRLVPVASRQLAASRRLSHAARDGAAVASSTLAELDRIIARPHRTGPQRVAVLRDLAAVAARTDRDLARIEVGSADALVGPLSRAVQELADQRDAGRTGAQRMGAVATALGTVLDGPEPYLLLGANNAEMRNGSGMFLSASTLGFDRGSLDLGPVRPTAETIRPAGSVPVGGDLEANWPWLDPGRDLRNLGLTADFPQSARVAAAHWAATPGGARVAGVLAIDVDGVRALLRVVGPVEVGGIRYTSDNVRGELLRNQYRRYGTDRVARRDQLGDVAKAVFARIQDGRWAIDELATQLVDAVAGRHVLVWSNRPSVQRAWRLVGADGHLTARSLSVGLLNRAAIKSDSWIATTADVRSSKGPGGRLAVTIRYRITSTVPASGPPYLVGPNVRGLHAGDHRGLVVANLPAGSTKVRLAGGGLFLDAPDGPTRTIGGEVTVRRGTTVTVTITALLPAGVRSVVLEPSARIPRTRWVVDGTPVGRDRRRTVDLDPT